MNAFPCFKREQENEKNTIHKNKSRGFPKFGVKEFWPKLQQTTVG